MAEELEAHEQKEPRGKLLLEESAVITNRRLTYEIRASGSDDTRLWHSRDSTAWTVVYESSNRFTVSCLNRFVYVKGVESVEEALQGADSIQQVISTVGIAVEEDREQALATQLARWGASRICPLGRMQNPPLAWRHDGRPALADLVTWTDWER